MTPPWPSLEGEHGFSTAWIVVWSLARNDGPNTPVTPTGDQPATAVRSWTLNIFTKRSEIAEKM